MRYGLDLQRKNMGSRRKKTLLIVAFVCFLVLLSAASLFMLWRSLNYDFSNIYKTAKTTAASEQGTTTTEPARQSYSGTADFLLVMTSDDGKAVRAMCLVDVDLGARILRIVPVAKNAGDPINSGATLEETFLQKGVSRLEESVGKLCSVKVDRYAVLTDSGCRFLFVKFGDLTVNLPEKVEYDTSDLFLELKSGDNDLTPEKAYKYYRYLCDHFSGKEAAERVADLVCSAFSAYYTPENVQNGSALFTYAVNHCTTDISIVDYTNAIPKIKSLLPSGNEKLKVLVSEKTAASEGTTDE